MFTIALLCCHTRVCMHTHRDTRTHLPPPLKWPAPTELSPRPAFPVQALGQAPLRLSHTLHHGITEVLPTPMLPCPSANPHPTLNASKCLYNSQPKPREDLPCVTIVHQGQKQRGRESLPMRRQTSGVAGTQIRSFEANEQVL